MKKMIVVAVLMAVVLFFVSCEKKPVVHDVQKAIETADTALKCLMKADYEQAYVYFSDDFKKEVSLEAFADSCGKNANMLGKWKKCEFKYYLDPKGQPDIELIYSCDFTKGVEYPMHIIMSLTNKGYEVGVLDYGYNFHPEKKGEEITKLTIKEKIVLKN